MRYIIGLLIVLTSCTNEPLNEKSFIWADDINADKERNFEPPEIENKINLDELDFESVYKLRMNEDRLFIYGARQILVIDKLNTEENYVMEFRKGRGPGEFLRMADYDVHNNRIYLADNDQAKMIIYDSNGEYMDEFLTPKIFADQIKVIDENSIMIHPANFNKEFVFLVTNTKGEIVKSFIEGEPDLNAMVYIGSFHIENNNIYFSGYSEPIIKKYSIEEEKLEYSVEVIDSYETTNNYMSSRSEEVFAQGFTEEAIYNSRGLAVFKDKLFNVVHHNGKADHKYVDVYNEEDGSYLKSFELIGYPRSNGIQVDENYLYSLERDTSGTSWLVMYKNNF